MSTCLPKRPFNDRAANNRAWTTIFEGFAQLINRLQEPEGRYYIPLADRLLELLEKRGEFELPLSEEPTLEQKVLAVRHYYGPQDALRQLHVIQTGNNAPDLVAATQAGTVGLVDGDEADICRMFGLGGGDGGDA